MERKAEAQGRQRVVTPMSTLTQLTPEIATSAAGYYTHVGVLPIGVYKGVAAFWDLDKANNQPLVLAEQQYILGILDGREEDYDLQTLGVVLNEAIGTIHTGILTVPAGVVWYLNAVVITVPAPGGANRFIANWRCSLWPDRAATPSTAGQTFHAADVVGGAGVLLVQDEFGVTGPLLVITNKQPLLRLPAGAILTVSVINTVAVAALAVAPTFQVLGFVGKPLVA